MINGHVYRFAWLAQSFTGLEEEFGPVTEAIDDVRRATEEAGGTYAIVFFPEKIRVLGPFCKWPPRSSIRDVQDHINPLRGRLARWAQDRGCPFLDLTDALREPLCRGEVPWFPLDTHPNAVGHEVITRAILQWDVFRFIRRKRALGLKKVDMLIPIGVALKHSKPGGQHVHQLVVSRLRHPRLPVHPHRLPGRPDDLHHPPRARDLPLFRLRFPRGRLPGPGRAAVPILAHRPPSDVRGPCPSPASNAGTVAWCVRSRSPSPTPGGATPTPSSAMPWNCRAHDHPRRGHAPGRQLGPDQGHPEARPVAAVRQAQAQAPAGHRHRRDRRRPRGTAT